MKCQGGAKGEGWREKSQRLTEIGGRSHEGGAKEEDGVVRLER